VRRRVDDAYAELGSAPEQTAIAVIGHSTRRNAESRKATEAQAARLREAGIAAQVEAVYLDDAPAIADIYTLTDAPTLIAVPFFLAEGSHTTQDVPQALGLPDSARRATVNGRDVYYTPPVGDDDSLTSIILDLAREAGASLYDPRSCDAWDGFPTAGRDILIEAVHEKGVLRFGQLCLTRDTVGVWGNSSATERITTPSTLRARVREQPFRPLATTADLPTGWHVEIGDDTMLHAVVETVYPGAVADWAAQQRGTFTSTPLAMTLARQTGLFREIAPMDEAAQAAWVARICGGCVRHPTWQNGASPAGTIPCAEPCNLWLSRVLEDN
jgi:sirohydrochlorin cobaltochelatase